MAKLEIKIPDGNTNRLQVKIDGEERNDIRSLKMDLVDDDMATVLVEFYVEEFELLNESDVVIHNVADRKA